MRATSLLRNLVGITDTRVAGYEAGADGEFLVFVRPTWRLPRCSGCGAVRRAGAITISERRRWRHLDLAGVKLFLCYDLRRVRCPACGSVVERVPWASDPTARFTDDFDDEVAWLAQRGLDKSAIEERLEIAWRSVGRAIDRVMRRRGKADRLADLRHVGVDEVSYRKGHHYLTLVADQIAGTVVWGREGKDAATLAAFFDELGEERRQQIESVSIDMSPAFEKAVRDAVPDADVVFDRFHVQALASKAVDDTRRELWQELRGTDEARVIKGTRWALLKDPLDLTDAERAKLADLQRNNRRLYRAYLLKEELGDILDRRQPNVVEALLRQWIAWGLRSRLPPFVKTAKTIRDHLDGILAYIRSRLSNGLLEGQNNKVRLITRRAYGFHSAEAVLAMVMLCCTGLVLLPVRKLFPFV